LDTDIVDANANANWLSFPKLLARCKATHSRWDEQLERLSGKKQKWLMS
jgi:hypothetical protein